MAIERQSTGNRSDKGPKATNMWRLAVCGLLLGAITLAVQASEDPTESLAGVHDLSKYIKLSMGLDDRSADHSVDTYVLIGLQGACVLQSFLDVHRLCTAFGAAHPLHACKQ